MDSNKIYTLEDNLTPRRPKHSLMKIEEKTSSIEGFSQNPNISPKINMESVKMEMTNISH